MDDVPHLALPLRIVGGGYVSVQQDTLDEVTACVACVTQFPLGYREEQPDFGITPMEFQQLPLDTLDVEQSVEAWEPRARVRVVGAPYDPNDPTAAEVRVEVAMTSETEADVG